MSEVAAAAVRSALSAKYIDIATTILVFYDWSIGLSDEIEFVWTSPSRSWLTKYIFLVLRYCTLAAQPISLIYDFIQISSESLCKMLVRTILSLTYVVLVSTESLIMLRLLTTYRGNKLIYRSFWLMFIAFVTVSTVFLIIWANNLHLVGVFAPSLDSGPIDVLPGCWSAFGGKILFIPFGIVISWEIVISIMTFLKTWHNFVRSGSSFWELFYRDGGHFYLWILAISFVDVGIAILFQIRDTSVIQDRILFSLERTVHSVCVTRLIFHVRRLGAAAEDPYDDSEPESLQLVRSRTIDSSKFTATKNGGKRLRDTWEGSRKQKAESSIIQIEDDRPGSRRSFLLPPSSATRTPAERDDIPIDDTDKQLEESIDEREREIFREWLLRVNADVASW